MMNISLYTSDSAVKAFDKKVGVIANNVANIQSEDFKKSRAIIQEDMSNQGVQVNISKVNTPGPQVSEYNDGKIMDIELSNVEIAEETTQSIAAERGYQANLKMITTADDMLGTSIDIIR
ncbi:MAG: hypothetical protein HQK77_11370 [Desulfobacterales bacterium]|nr:hypothetical protein [Desulfobacterales bacterium]